MLSVNAIVELLCEVPAYTEATFVLEGGREVRGMARDFPRKSNRRWTVDGWEWFIDHGTFERLTIAEVRFDSFDIGVEQDEKAHA